jgi:membrane-bound lytic murein transglycosylase D
MGLNIRPNFDIFPQSLKGAQMKPRYLVILILLVLLPSSGCSWYSGNGGNSNGIDDSAPGSEEELYLLYPQLLHLQKKLDTAYAFYYFGDLESSLLLSEELIKDVEELKLISPAPVVCEHLDGFADQSMVLQQRISDDEMERTWKIHITTVLDSLAQNHVVEDEIEVVLNWRTEHWLKYFQGKGRKYFQKWLIRVEQYRGIIEPILIEVGVPRDLLYLAVIESGLNLNARSRVNAVGPWQFMAGTGRLFGLRINWWIDERKDIIAATYASAHYMKHLYSLFGSWELALAAYNSGEYRVAHAISRQRTDDYWRLNLPSQTRWFVPKYMAALQIGRNPAAYGFRVPKTKPYTFDIIPINRSTDLKIIAKASSSTVTGIKKLNPALKRWATPPDMSIELKVPEGTGEKTLAALAEVPPEELVSWHRHKVRRGEALSQIARRYEISTGELKRINGIKNANRIREGSILLIPVKDAGEASKVASNPNYRTPPKLPEKITLKRYKAPPGHTKVIYTVKDRDTLGEIAERYHVGLSKLRGWNDLRYRSVIHPGDKLVIYVPPKYASQIPDDDNGKVEPDTNGKKRVVHVVRRGETLTHISRRYGANISDILAWNNGIRRDRLYPGDNLTIWVEVD